MRAVFPIKFGLIKDGDNFWLDEKGSMWVKCLEGGELNTWNAVNSTNSSQCIQVHENTWVLQYK